MTPDIAQAADVADIPLLDETDDEELIPTIQQLLGDIRTRSSQQQSQGKRGGAVPTPKHIAEEGRGTEVGRESSLEDPTVGGTENSADERDDEEPDDAKQEVDQFDNDEIPKVKEEEPQEMDFAFAASSDSTSVSVSVKRKPRPLVPITPRAQKPRPGSLAAPIEIPASPSDTADPTAVSPCGKRSSGSDDFRSAKRARKVRLVAKHETHWYLDGNIIVKIKNTQFRLHRSRLVRMSDWFHAKLEPGSMGHDTKGISHVGNDVVVEVNENDVTAEDFEIILDAFDDAISYYHEEPPFEIVAAILRASTFFRVSNFRNWAVRILEEKWSSDLADVFPEPISYARESVILARKFSVPTILKRALYELVRHEDDDDDYKFQSCESRPRLSDKDTKSLNRALRLLVPKWLSVTSHSSPDFGHCPAQNAECTTADPRATQEAHRNLVILSGIQNDYSGDPLSGLQAMMEAPWEEQGFCQQCVAMRRTAWENTRERIWADCDIWFGLHKS